WRRIAQIAVVPERQEEDRTSPQRTEQQSPLSGWPDESSESQRQQGQRNEIKSRTRIEHGAEIAPKVSERKDVAGFVEPSGFAGPSQQSRFQGGAKVEQVPRQRQRRRGRRERQRCFRAQ